MAESINTSIDFTDLVDILKKKYCEQVHQNESLKETNDLLIKENTDLKKENTDLKKEIEHLKNELKLLISLSLPSSEFKSSTQKSNAESDEDDFKHVIAETFCAEMLDETHYSVNQSENFENCQTSPIICTKFQKPNKQDNLKHTEEKCTLNNKKLENCVPSWDNLEYVPETPDVIQNSKSIFTFGKSFKSNKRPPLVSTENSPKSKLKKGETYNSPVLFESSDDSFFINECNKSSDSIKNKGKPRTSTFIKPVTKGTKLKQMSVIKCFKRSTPSSPENVFNFEDTDIMNENISSNPNLDESAILSGNGSLFNDFKTYSISPNSRLSPARKRLNFNMCEADSSTKKSTPKDCDKINSNKSVNEQKNLNADNSFLYIRDPVRKKSDRKKLQGWSCEDCQKYYEGANLTESQMQAKINECSKHRDNHNPFASNTPPGYWNPEFPPTQEIDRTQTGHKISSK